MFVHLVITETEAVMEMGPEILVAPFVTQMRRIVARLRPAHVMQAMVVLLSMLHALHVHQVRTTRWPPAMALARHAMRTPARAHVLGPPQAHVKQAILALIAVRHARRA